VPGRHNERIDLELIRRSGEVELRVGHWWRRYGFRQRVGEQRYRCHPGRERVFCSSASNQLLPSCHALYPVTPCRLIDTRNSAGARGGPSFIAGQKRTSALVGQCGLPDLSNGGALSVNVTAVPKGGLG
jgi:hypothetical protein